VGPKLDLEEIFKEDFVPIVRAGPAGMPAFSDTILSDGDLDSIYAFLKSGRSVPAPSDGAGSR
jgi:hypothetical protein